MSNAPVPLRGVQQLYMRILWKDPFRTMHVHMRVFRVGGRFEQLLTARTAVAPGRRADRCQCCNITSTGRACQPLRG